MTKFQLNNTLFYFFTLICFIGIKTDLKADALPFLGGDGDNSEIWVDFNECTAFTDGSNMDYSEFTGINTPIDDCTGLELTSAYIYRNNTGSNIHSCTPGLGGTEALCVSSELGCQFIDDADKAIRFEVSVTPGVSGTGTLSGIEFQEQSPFDFDWVDGDSGLNNYPRFYGIRVLKNGVEVYKEIDIATERLWNLESFSFSNNPEFTVTEASLFSFELLPYCVAGNISPVSAWDIEDLRIFGACASVEGGVISTNDPTEICAGDGIPDMIDVSLTGNEGANSVWVITDSNLDILALPSGPPFDLDGAGPGVCLIWHLSYEGTITGANVGDNATEIQGCYSLSNEITVFRTQVEGGDIAFEDGTTETSICGDELVSVNVSGNSGSNMSWVITSLDGEILGLQSNSPFALPASGSGTCLIWNIAFSDVEGAVIGANANDLDGCFDLSNPITVNKGAVNGGSITSNGMTEFTICADDGISDAIDVMLTNNTGENGAWVITDSDLNILDLPTSPPFDFEGAGAGTCIIWYVSYDDITGLEVGANAADLDGCYGLSNGITVIRLIGDDCGVTPPTCDVVAATIDTDGLTELTICADDAVSDAFTANLTGGSGLNGTWVVTDSDLNILDITSNSTFDFEGAGAGVCLVWHVYFDDIEGAEVGMNAANLSGCFALSNPISVTRLTGDDCGIDPPTCDASAGTIGYNGITSMTICADDGVTDVFSPTVNNGQGTNEIWVVTDQDLNILDLTSDPTFDFEGAGAGVCLVWHVYYEDISGAEVGLNAANLMGCYALSNPITVTRLTGDDCMETGCADVDGGVISTESGENVVTVCAGAADPASLDILLEDEFGPNSLWLITDDQGNIVNLPFDPPFVIKQSNPIACYIYHVSYDEDFSGALVGNHLDDLMGCFDLSNGILVLVAHQPNSPFLSTTQGFTEVEICEGDGVSDLFDTNLFNVTGSDGYYLVTEADGTILAISDDSSFDFEGAGIGICYVWYVSYNDEMPVATIGANANDLDGCYALSNPIIVNRIDCDDPNPPGCNVEGGSIGSNGLTEFTICADDGVSDAFSISVSGDFGANSIWVITDINGNILGLQDSGTVDFEGAGAGTCLVWHLSYEDDLTGASIGANASNLGGCFDLSNPFTIYRNTGDDCTGTPPPPGCNVEGGTVGSNGLTEFTVCADDGVSDAFSITASGAFGPNSIWVITDENLNILDLQTSSTFDFEGAGAGTCLVWHLSYDDDLGGATIGANAANLTGCFDLSNAFTVYRLTGDDCPNNPPPPSCNVEGGTVGSNGLTEFTICADDGVSDAFSITASGAFGPNSIWVITDENLNILDLQTSSTFDFEGAGAGTCLVWHLSYDDDLGGATIGANAGNLTGCFDLSNPFTVYRLTGDDCPNNPPPPECLAEGGSISTGGATALTICADDGMSDAFIVDLFGASADNGTYVITDADGMILDITADNTFDFEGAGAGVCLVWYLAYDDIEGATVGANASNLTGCFDLSNPITVTRLTGDDCGGPNPVCDADGGTISVNGSDALTICADDGVSNLFFADLTGAIGSNMAFVITDIDGNILDITSDNGFDFEGAGAGVCLVWHISYESDLTGAEVGMNAADLGGCFDLSNPIAVTRLVGDDCNGGPDCTVEGGSITFENGSTELDICSSDFFDVDLVGNVGPSFDWIITDTDCNIIDLIWDPPFNNLDILNTDTCLIWYMSYEGIIDGVEVGESLKDIEGCYDLSNSIQVVKNEPDGGSLTTANSAGATILDLCLIDGEEECVDVDLIGDFGANNAWVLTDENGTITTLTASPPFCFPETGSGTTLIWNVSYYELSGAFVGANAADLGGCFDLSNPITVTYDCIDGGTLTTNSGDTEYHICNNDGTPQTIGVDLDNSKGSAAWVITDENGIIQDITSPPFQFPGTGSGTSLIWHLSAGDNLGGAMIGQSAADLTGCYDLSNAITVTYDDVDGGSVSANGGSTDIELCVSDSTPDSLFMNNSSIFGDYEYVITNTNNVIIGSSSSDTILISSSIADTCRVWGLSYTGDYEGANGMNAATSVLSTGCYELSSNFIEVVKVTSGGACNGGIVNDINTGLQFNVYPNPANELLYIDLQMIDNQEVDIQVVDVYGKQIKHMNIIDNERSVISMDLSTLANGQYFIKVISGRQASTMKFSKTE